MTHEWSRDVAIAPDGALQRIAAAINRPKKRAFGVLKIESEFVGFIRDDRFEIWERHQRAVHALGSVHGRSGGSRVELRFAMPGRTRALIAVFFVVYAAAVAGLAFPTGGSLGTPEVLLIASLGALLLATIFILARARQRSALRALFDRLFRDVPQI